MTNPENIQTGSRLSSGQVEYITDAFYINQMWPEFEPLKIHAEELAETMISHQGLGREEIIRYMGAISEAKLLEKLGIVKSEQKTKEKE